MMYNILIPWVDNPKSAEYKKYNGYHTGVDLDVVDINSIADGVVINIGKEPDGYAVTIQYDKSQCLRYMHLEQVYVIGGQTIHKGDAIGKANRYLHFEYITDTQDTSIWPVRISKLLFYKHDPTPIIDGTITFRCECDEWYNGLTINYDEEGDCCGGAY